MKSSGFDRVGAVVFCRIIGFASDFRLPITSADMCRAWRSRMEEPNNTL